MRALLLAVIPLFVALAGARAATYDVGPGKPLATIGAVPWEALQPGDLVRIHWRPAPYLEKWVICRQGTAAAPITVRGILGPAGERPVIDGNGATTRLALDYWSEQRGVIKIGGASIPADTMPKFITVENLDIRSARLPYAFTDDSGTAQNYVAASSAIFVEKGENIVVRNCLLHDCGNGFFVASSVEEASRDVLVEGNSIYDNGNLNSLFEHNNYTAAVGITFQYNHFGPLRAGCPGNNLKDRSAGFVARYNWIESGNRQLDLVDAEDSPLIRDDPRYRTTLVYGNVLIEPDGAGNRQIIHYGGDSGTLADYRKGTLYCYNNTIVSTRADRTTLFRLSTDEERCDARNNVFYVSAAGNTLSLMDSDGVLDVTHNWAKPGWVASFGVFEGTVNNDGTFITGAAPGFSNEAAQDFRLTRFAACVNAGGALAAAVLPAHALARHYVKHQGAEARPLAGALDVGAFEYSRIEAWRVVQFGASAADPAIAGDAANIDQDGLPNLAEYALASDPLAFSAGKPAVAIQSIGGVKYLTLSFDRLAPPAEVTYVVEATDDLLSGWRAGSIYADSTDTPASTQTTEVSRTGTDPIRITVRRQLPMSASPSQLLRLRITRP